MVHQNITDVISKIVEDPELAKSEKISQLEKLRQDARAEMRAASESAMVDDVETGDDLKQLDLALEKLGSDPDSIEDNSTATL
ncbi:MAG: hypothetical protein KUA43_07805 [Hoeflea sp.]|uniref:hypothetical protein n=1 Tax=Hoeflea sp. TaxID=1940281 RepID=UPI001DBFF7D6|nr:hypothetical protein [Hoeflea sp.]MBU4528864.1 hypothetical protein [Alphaproteobacteria bacterium]MBU4543997.1 hypothetical protein [Alphaproteobacteria bacterium]MBU4551866.1 hypothetical protein [Alphaproteobacteria bacterium]MBV1723331.1 hypothetical protein [Hoeflea sp.]MBV1760310.1 hypothetical protein [Hoeflea sp.]